MNQFIFSWKMMFIICLKKRISLLYSIPIELQLINIIITWSSSNIAQNVFIEILRNVYAILSLLFRFRWYLALHCCGKLYVSNHCSPIIWVICQVFNHTSKYFNTGYSLLINKTIFSTMWFFSKIAIYIWSNFIFIITERFIYKLNWIEIIIFLITRNSYTTKIMTICEFCLFWIIFMCSIYTAEFLTSFNFPTLWNL